MSSSYGRRYPLKLFCSKDNNNKNNINSMPAKRNNIHSIHSNNGDDKDGGFQSWVSTIPLITRYWFVATLFFTLIVNFRYVPYHVVAWSWGKIVHNFEIWRFLTPFLYAGPFHPTLLFTLHNLLVFSRLHEMSPINTGGGAGTSDYVFTLLFGAFGIIPTYPWFSGPIFTRNLTFFVAYTWSRRHLESKVDVMFLGRVPSFVFPFAYVVIELLSGRPYMDLIHGIVIGHVYHFLTDWVPIVYGVELLHTPMFLIRAFGVGEYKASGKNMKFKAKESKKKARHYWGGNGQRLGTSAPSRSSSGCTQSKLLSMPTPVDEDENFDYAPSPTEEQRDEEEEERESKVLLQSFSEESPSAIQDEVKLLMKEKELEESVLRRRIRMMDAMSDEIKATRYD